MTTNEDRAEWPARPILLAVIGAIAAVIVHTLVVQPRSADVTALRLSAGVFVGVFAALVAFTLERIRPFWTLAFALAGASVAAFVAWSSGPVRGWEAGEGWQMTSALLAIAIAAPLFQTARDDHRVGGRSRFAYPDVHGHAWTNVVMFGAACVFASIAFALGWLIASLFRLIGVDLLHDLMNKGWFDALLVGAALGGAVGLLRERDRILPTLLTVVLVILRVLAPVLALFLAAFLLFLPFTGLATLWDATRSTTPVVLGCMIVALVLTNAVVGQDDADAARSPLLRLAARVLSVTLLPLALIAAVSLGLRIAQHGLTVDRLWALAFVVVATAYGLAYLVSVLRPGWVERLRAANLRLAFGLCAVALLLALPIIGFNRIATNDQVARLESGRIAADQFDWAALRYDFGAPGKAAVERLARTGSPATRTAATRALASTDRFELGNERANRAQCAGFEQRLRVLPAGTAVPTELRDAIVATGLCLSRQRGALIVGQSEALLVTQSCPTCSAQVQPFDNRDKRWRASQGNIARDPDAGAVRRALENGPVEVRPVTRRQVFVGGEPVGGTFE